MRIESSYPTPTMGVSTLAPRNRLDGQAGVQTNFRSDPVHKLVRRPASRWVAQLLAGVDHQNILSHSYRRDNTTFRYILDKVSGTIYTFIDNVLHTTLTSPVGYVGQNMVTQTVNHRTYFVNKDKTVELSPDTDENTVEKVSHINVVSALNYGETVKVNVTFHNGTRASVSISVPDLGTTPDYDTADKARATRQVAIDLASAINTIFNVQAYPLGSSVAVKQTDGLNWVDLEIETGQGDRSCVAINQIVESTDGFPLFAKVGARVKVRPDPTSEKGSYYLQAERVADIPSGEELEEVVWAETRTQYEPYALDNTTTPFSIVFKNNIFTVDNLSFKERQSGDNDSVPPPDFVGSTIENIGYFQKRLVLISENNVIMSETDDTLNFWKQSAVQLLVNDTVSVSSSAVGVDRLRHLVPHNRDQLVVSSNTQFKIDGNQAVTPQTVSMPVTTSYECQVSAAPVAMGSSVFIPISYGNSTGIQEYTGQKETNQDVAESVTSHIVGYLSGDVKLLKASPNLDMLAVVSTGMSHNEVAIYEQFTKLQDDVKQQAWCKWVLSPDTIIVDLEFSADKLTVLASELGNLVIKEIHMYSQFTTLDTEIFLDDIMKLSTDGLTVTIPTGYNTNDMVIVRGDGTKFELNTVDYTLLGNTATLEENIDSGSVYIGKLYESCYEPTRPFRRDDNGNTITTDRLRISRYIISLVDTNEMHMAINSDFYDTISQTFNSRYMGRFNNLIGEIPLHTGDVKMSYAQDAALATARFYCNNHLGCSIAGISWEGQYFQSKGRM